MDINLYKLTSMKRVVIGTAGHVDHGKTSLIKALTGVDCDRLKEEKERGLTIELGFTALTLPSGERVGVIDVPGHVKFIRHMLSGASGIDLVVLVVAADEGIMPQTVEHVQICELLGIERGVIALSKIDTVDADLFDLALSDIKTFIVDTFLQDAPIIPVSSVTGEGLDKLAEAIEQEVRQVKERQVTGIPFLPIDRVFTIKGFGTVVTGTLARGRFTPGEDVEIQPSGIKAKIRNIQIHSESVEEAMAGMRTAINLQGVDKDQILRGEWLVPAGVFTPTRVIDARLKLIKAPGRGGIKLYIGTAEVIGSLSLHMVDGQNVARIRLKEPIIASCGNKFIIRNISPGATLGGGIVLNPCPLRRFSEEVARDLLAEGYSRRIIGMVKDAGIQGIAKKELVSRFADLSPTIERAIQDLQSKGDIIRFDTQNDLFVSADFFQVLKDGIKGVVHAFHSRNLSSPGISKEHLRSSLKGDVDQRLFHKVLMELVRSQTIEEEGAYIREKGFSASLGNDIDLSDKVYTMLMKAGLEPPGMRDLCEQFGIDEKKLSQVLGFMTRAGRLVKIKEDIYLTDRHEADLKGKVKAFLKQKQVMSPIDMKTVAGVSRKYAIPYMEYLDRIRFTVRVGNERKLFSQN